MGVILALLTIIIGGIGIGCGIYAVVFGIIALLAALGLKRD